MAFAPHTAPPAHRPPSDTAPRIVCAAIGVVALLITLLVASTDSGGKGSAGAAPAPPTLPPASADVDISLRPSPTTPSATEVTPTIRTGAQLRRLFPLPPGSVQKQATRNVNGDGPQSRVVIWFVRASLPAIRDFYARELPRLGYAWSPLSTRLKGTSLIIRYFTSLLSPTGDRSADGAVQLAIRYGNPNYVARQIPLGTVAIELYIDDISG